MKKSVIILIITDLLLVAGLIVTNVLSYYRGVALGNQMTFLQDTTNIIQTNLTNMEANIEATLEEESSLLEDYSVQVTDIDSEAGTYSVEISILPKEYTDSTMASVFFGTHEYHLELSGYHYQGVATLPLATRYDGNVTILLTNGEKKNTEVLNNYEGIQTKLEKVLAGTFSSNSLNYQDGTLQLDADVSYALEGGADFEFENFELVVAAGGKEFYNYDLILENGGLLENENDTQESAERGEEAGNPLTDEMEELENTVDAENAGEEISQTDEAVPEEMAGGEQEGNLLEEEMGEASGEEPAEGNIQDEEPTPGEVVQEQGESKETPAQEGLLISGMSGDCNLSFSTEVYGAKMVQVYLRAVTKDGYEFRYYLFQTYTKPDRSELVEAQTSYDTLYFLIDKKGQKIRIDTLL